MVNRRFAIGLPELVSVSEERRLPIAAHIGKPRTVSVVSDSWPIANRPQVANLPHKKIVAACEDADG
jgi:hypothetical protein